MSDFDTERLLTSQNDFVNIKSFTPAQMSAIHSPILRAQLELSQLTCQDLILPWSSKISKNPYISQKTEPTTPELLAKHWEEFQNVFKDNNKDNLYKFIEKQELPKPDLVLRWQLVFDILVILRKHYPNSEVYPFGTLLTGLGDISSDIDIWIDINGDRGKLIQENPSGKKLVISILENVMKTIQQSQCPDNAKIPFTQNAKSLGTRVPYLKFIHNPSQIECDLTFGNRLTLQNSRLTQLYMKLDPRVKQFLVLLFYWKRNGPAKELKVRKYPLILLTTQFFIQTGILPSVSHLQALAAEQRASKKNPDEILGWDASFCEDINLIMSTFIRNEETAQQTVMELLKEFMEYVATTDFSKVVDCPLLGELMPKTLIAENLHEANLKCTDVDIPILWMDWSAKQKKIKRKLEIDVPLCIQDPFVLNDNVGVLTDFETLNRFQMCCHNFPKNKL